MGFQIKVTNSVTIFGFQLFNWSVKLAMHVQIQSESVFAAHIFRSKGDGIELFLVSSPMYSWVINFKLNLVLLSVWMNVRINLPFSHRETELWQGSNFYQKKSLFFQFIIIYFYLKTWRIFFQKYIYALHIHPNSAW